MEQNIRYINLLCPETCKLHKNSLFVFGDNLQGWGKGGQARIRDEPNAFGIPTKREPNMLPHAFFSDKPDEIMIVLAKIKELENFNGIVYLPKTPIGSGRARLKEKSPLIYEIIMEELYNKDQSKLNMRA